MALLYDQKPVADRRGMPMSTDADGLWHWEGTYSFD
jgi:hypothetical protein